MSGAGVDCVLEAVSAPLVFGRRVGCAVLRLPTESQVFGLLDWRRSAEARSPSSWSFAAAHASAALRVVTHAEQRETAGLRYANPAGGGVDCLNSKLARLSVVLERPGQRSLRLLSDSAALEHGLVGAHSVRMLL
ncbi:MAG: hypothetical protein KC766_09550 [Myxococcales bacterium]|nr:hypothetical protein [Myxococcales bacterium]